jgi:hypothetical protein
MHDANSVDKKSTIFVTIAACQEYFIEHTIKSAMYLAAYPERIHFGVFNNILEKEKSLMDKQFFNNHPNILYIELLSNVPMGVGFGRMNASLLSTQDHDYVLQIDAHTVFTKDWDLKLIENFSNISKEIDSDNIVLTAIPRGNLYYDIKDRDSLMSDDDIFLNNNIKKIDIYNNNYHEFADLDEPYHNTKPQIIFDGWQGKNFTESMVGFPVTYGVHEFGDGEYQEVSCIHASIVFSKYKMTRDIMHDPEDSFHGDQVNYGLRLLSRGYRIFAIKKPLMLSLDKFAKHTVENSDEGILIDPEWNWRAAHNMLEPGKRYLVKIQALAKNNYDKIFSGEYVGYWGAPDTESLKHAKEKMGFLKKYDQEL